MSHEVDTDIQYFSCETAFVFDVSNLPTNCRIEANMKFHSHDTSDFRIYENNEF